MPTEMTACPHCGTANSTKKSTCYACRKDMHPVAAVATADPPPPRSTTPAPTGTRSKVVKAPSAPAPVTMSPATPPPPRPRSRASALLGATTMQRVQFYRQMQSLVHTGMPLGLCLNYVQENIAYALRPTVRDLASAVQGGEKLSDNMAHYPNLFQEWEVSVIRAAELGGTLPEAMQNIADSLEMEMSLRTRVLASTLPVIATFFVFVLVLLVVNAVRSSGGGIENVIPALQQAALQFGLLVGAGIIVWQGWQVFTRTRVGGNINFHLVSYLPILGPLLRNMMRLRFVRVLASLWGAGVGPLEALDTSARATNNRQVMRIIKEGLPKLGQGGTLAEVVQSTRILPPEAMYLLQSGETTGTVSEALLKVAEYIKMELDAQAQTLPMKVQLIGYAIIGPLVGALIISFWSNYFSKLGF